MILNLSKIKTEALLLFCKDLILSYKDIEDSSSYGLNEDVIFKFNEISNEMLKQITIVTFPNEYYLKNSAHYKIKAILNCYNFINNEISSLLKQGEAFNPSMLYFSLLALWFKELNKESKSKEYIYFILYPYGNIYDKFLVEIKNSEYKSLNIKMIELAEKIVLKLDKYMF